MAPPVATTTTTTIVTTTLTPHVANTKKGKAPAAANAGGSKKRKLANGSGDELDLTKIDPNGPVTPAIIEAMRLRIIELEDQLASLGAAKPPPAKRARASVAKEEMMDVDVAPLTTSAPVAGPSTGGTKADEKKRKIHLKKIFDQLKKECKSDNCKFQGTSKPIKFDEVYEVDDFNAIFMGKGRLVQPTPENKPKSTVTIITYNATQIKELFGDELKALKGNRWSRGGVPVRSYGLFGGGGSSFSKSVKQGVCDVEIHSLEVNYSKNGMKCTLKFEVEEVGGGYDRYDDW